MVWNSALIKMLRLTFVERKSVCIFFLLMNINNFVSKALGKEKHVNNGSMHTPFISNEDTVYVSNEYADIKQQIGIDKNEADIFYGKIKRQLKKQIEKIKEKGSEIIPETTFQRIINNKGHLSESNIRKVQKHGILIVRNTIPQKEALNMMSDILDYMDRNYMYQANNFSHTAHEIFWSKPQMKARQHPNMIKVQKALLEDLWHKNQDNEVDVDLRLQIRNPGDNAFFEPPHLDQGNVERWSDKTYRKVYRKILEDLDMESYDPFEVDYRIEAHINKMVNVNGRSAFRAFQGFLSFSNSEPGAGTLKVMPLLREPIAYILIRPFLSDVDVNQMPGCVPSKLFQISQKWHSDIYDEMISIPRLYPGDTVWWHPDLVHSIENKLEGNEANSVMYISAAPDCQMNRAYLRKLRHSFILGKTPPDFPESDSEIKLEEKANISDLSNVGRKSMGWEIEEELITKQFNEKCE